MLLKGRSLLSEGYFEEAAEVLKEVVLLEDSYSTSELPTIDAELARKFYADALASVGQFQEALKAYQQALPILKESFGEQHKSVVEIENSIYELTSTPNLTLIENNDDLKNNKRSK